jgi:hypothetical protein
MPSSVCREVHPAEPGAVTLLGDLIDADREASGN